MRALIRRQPGPAPVKPAVKRAHPALAILVVVAALTGCSAAIPQSSGMPTTVPTAQPAAYRDLCGRHPDLCAMPADATADAQLVLDAEAFAEIEQVNMQVNWALRYRSDREVYGKIEHWTVAADGEAGDCEDFALTKLQRLLDRGYPRGAMRLAIVRRLQDGGRHAVLTVETDRGIYALDSSYDRVHAWSDLPYSNWLRERPGHDRWDLAIEQRAAR